MDEKKVKGIFCHTDPTNNGTTNIAVLETDGQLLHATVPTNQLYRWLADNAKLTPVSQIETAASGGPGALRRAG